MRYSRDDVLRDNLLRNQYIQYYQDIRCTFISLNSVVVYPKADTLSFGYVAYKDLDVGDVTLLDVPCVTMLDGTVLFNNGRNFILT